MILETLGVVFGSTGFGTVVGLLGSAVTRWFEKKQREQEFKERLELRKLDIEEMRLEQSHELAVADKQMQRAEVESTIAINKGELTAFSKSIGIGAIKSGVAWVDGFNSLMRPIITLFFLGVSTWFAYEVHRLLGGLEALHPEKLFELYLKIIGTILFLTSTCVTWWFGARPTKVKER